MSEQTTQTTSTRVRPPSRPLNRRSVGPVTMSSILTPNSSSNLIASLTDPPINNNNSASTPPSIPTLPPRVTPVRPPLPERPVANTAPTPPTSKPPLPEKRSVNSTSRPPLPDRPTLPEKPPLPGKPQFSLPLSSDVPRYTRASTTLGLSKDDNEKPVIPERHEMQRRTSDAPLPSPSSFERRLSECTPPKSLQLNNNINLSSINQSLQQKAANTKNHTKSMEFLKGLIDKFGKDFEWFSKNWEMQQDSKKEEYLQSLLQYFQTFNFVDSSPSNSLPNSPPSSAPTQPGSSGISPFLHMSIKEKWVKTDSNLSVTFEAARLNELSGLVDPFQNMLTSLISSTYKAINVQFDACEESNTNESIDVQKIQSSIIPLITKIIDVISEDGNSSVQLINETRKRILTQISNTNYESQAKEHILKAADQFHNPKYLNKLVVIRLNTILSRLRSLVVQTANSIRGLDSKNFIVDHKTILEVLSCLRLTTTTLKKVADQLATSLALVKSIEEKNLLNVEKTKKKDKTFSLRRKKNSDATDTIYSFNVNQPKLEGWEDGAGTLNSLVLKLTSTESIDSTFMKAFITTYPTFTTTELVLQKCLERYAVPKSISAEERMQIQLRVCVVFRYWIENKIKDFDDQVIEKFNDFIETLKCDGHMDASKMLKTTIDKFIDKVNEDVVVPSPAIEVFNVKYSPTEMFMNSSEKDIAEQITLISWRMYKDIDVNELLKLAWTKKETRHRSPNIKAFIKRFNHVSFWVPTMVLFHEKLKDRSKVISKFIGVSQELRKLNNFDGLMYIISGLRNSAVDRLKFSKFTVHEDQLVAFEELAAMMDPHQSWKTYRETLRASSLPAIPFMGVYLTDLTFIEDGNSDYYRDGELINFNKRQMVYKVLQEVLLYQTVAYQIEPKEPLLSYLTQIPFIEEADLYSLSMQREPRNATIKDLV